MTPFELQVSNPRNPSYAAEHNLRYAGVSTSRTRHINFGVALWGPAGILPAELDTAVEVTVVDSLNNPLFVVFPYYGQDPSTGVPTNVYLTGVYDVVANTTACSSLPTDWTPRSSTRASSRTTCSSCRRR